MNHDVDFLRALFSLVFVLGLVWLIGFAVRKYGWKWGMPVAPLTGKSRRLSIVESLAVDGKSRLVLIRRDQAEHLLLVGDGNSQIIESNIPTTENNA